jgi:hypothetical protein
VKSTEEFFKTPSAEEFLKELRHELLKVQRPADQIILDDFDFCQFLKISKRHSANLRAKSAITYSKAGGKLYYKLSDILLFIDKHEIKSVDRSCNIFNPKNYKK